MKTILIIFISLVGMTNTLTASSQLNEETTDQNNFTEEVMVSLSDSFLAEQTLSLFSDSDEGTIYRAKRPDVETDEGGSGNIPVGGGMLILIFLSLIYLLSLRYQSKLRKGTR